jgi:pimeloyl-ACP methyl ester carboxylesterase
MTTKKNIIAGAIITGALTLQATLSEAQGGSSAVKIAEQILPFKVHFSDADLADLKRRILETRWPDPELVKDASQGVQVATMQKLAKYWATEYDWRKVEARLNALPQFTTRIDGVDFHFIHVRSKNPNALPMLITHGWPGSIIEQLKVIGPLTDPTAYGGKVEDAFDVVIPSMPGYGFSSKPTELGWTPIRIASAWIELMKRLGYKKFVAQGGDWGNAISEIMGLMAPPELLAIHTNMPATVPAEISKALASGKMPDGLTADEQNAFKQLGYFYGKGLGYALEMGNRPQTLYGIADSPVGLAGWILDHDISSYELIARAFNGQKEGLTRDDILDNITLYWLTNTAISSARLYWETVQIAKGGGFFDPRNVPVAVAVSVFPDEIYAAPENWTRKAYPKLIYYNKLDKGGHFAAWEQPQAFAEEMRKAFKSVR